MLFNNIGGDVSWISGSFLFFAVGAIMFYRIASWLHSFSLAENKPI